MKKFQNGKDVVLTMTEYEYQMLKVMVTSGVVRREEQGFFNNELIEELRIVRDKICDYE